MKIIITELECKRCNWVWFPRTNKLPKVCPKCKSPYWNTDKKEKG